MINPGTFALRWTILTAAVFTLLMSSHAQESTAVLSGNAQIKELDSQVRQLRALIEQMRSENAQSRSEMRELRQQLLDTRKLLEPIRASRVEDSARSAQAESDALDSPATTDLSGRVQKLEESSQLLGAKIDEQYQTKVETAAKYRGRLSGIVLMNAFRNTGGSDNLDFPNYAQPLAAGDNHSSFGATMRQSEIGLEIFGPTVAGAKTSAHLVFDFAGGFPATANGINFGIVRMQTASLRLDWDHTSVVAGQDALFFSPLSPTSFASLATPAFAYAGNLWGWIPQIRVEHRFNLGERQTLTLQGGIMDNEDWEAPSDPYYRSTQAGERSGQPAYALRTAWSRPVFEHPLTIAVAGYYSRQNWTWNRYVDAWAGMTDWQIPILPRLSLAGEFYRGRGVGGLGAGIGQTILYGGSPVSASSAIRGVDSAGGWCQLKFQLTPKLELNGTVAEDDAFAGSIRGFATDANNFSPILGRNRGALGNLVYRPRSDLLLAAELRRMHTFPIYESSSVTNQINLSMGILF